MTSSCSDPGASFRRLWDFYSLSDSAVAAVDVVAEATTAFASSIQVWHPCSERPTTSPCRVSIISLRCFGLRWLSSLIESTPMLLSISAYLGPMPLSSAKSFGTWVRCGLFSGWVSTAYLLYRKLLTMQRSFLSPEAVQLIDTVTAAAAGPPTLRDVQHVGNRASTKSYKAFSCIARICASLT